MATGCIRRVLSQTLPLLRLIQQRWSVCQEFLFKQTLVIPITRQAQEALVYSTRLRNEHPSHTLLLLKYFSLLLPWQMLVGRWLIAPRPTTFVYSSKIPSYQ